MLIAKKKIDHVNQMCGRVNNIYHTYWGSNKLIHKKNVNQMCERVNNIYHTYWGSTTLIHNKNEWFKSTDHAGWWINRENFETKKGQRSASTTSLEKQIKIGSY